MKKSREETEERKKEIEQLQNKVNQCLLCFFIENIPIVFQVTEGILLMEGEEEVLKGTKTKYFELFPERSYKQGKSMNIVSVYLFSGNGFDRFSS